jgi:uncharacterized protein
MDLTLTLAGFLVGIIVGLTGMGGGALMAPVLILGLGVPPVLAVGTDLVYSAITKWVGVFFHARQGTIDLALTRRLAIGSLPSGLAAVIAVRLLSASGVDLNEPVRRMLGLALAAIAAVWLARLAGVRVWQVPEDWRPTLQKQGTVVAGALVGALVGLTSVGSGALLVPFLASVFALTPARLVGTDIFHAAILVTVTGLAHAHGGSVDWMLAAGLLTGSIPGVALGSTVAPNVPVGALRAGLATLLLITGLTLL